MLKQAITLFESKRNSESENLVKKILKVNAHNIYALRLMAAINSEKDNHAEALQFLKKIINKYPNEIDIYYNIAIANIKLNNFENALLSIKKYITFDSNKKEAWLSYGTILFNLNKYEEALSANTKAIDIDNNYGEAWSNHGVTLSKLGRHEEAQISIQKALLINPNYAEAWINLSVTLKNLKFYEKSFAAIQKAIEVDPNYLNFSETWINQGVLLVELMRYEEAIATYDKALLIDPKNPKAWSNKGVALAELSRYEDAHICYDKAISLKKDYEAAWLNKGVAYKYQKLYDKAMEANNTALLYKPDYADAWSNQGIVYSELKLYDDALVAFKKAIDIDSNCLDAKFNYSQEELRRFNFAKGWIEIESRWGASGSDSKKLITSKPSWNGNNFSGTLLVWSEQGIGDQILYSSMLKDLAKFEQKKIITLDSKLISLYKKSFPEYEFFDKNIQIPEEKYDQQIAIGSVGKFLRTSIEAFSDYKYPFIFSPKLKFQNLRKEISCNDKIICGISWKSVNRHFRNDKSIDLKEFIPLFLNPKIIFINLQYGSTEDEVEEINSLYGNKIISTDNDNYNDFEGLADLIDICDLVVSSSNTTAHLSGALGKKTYLLAPYSAGKFWYWHNISGRSLWYPSIEIIEQTNLSGWDRPIDLIIKKINSQFEL